MREKNRLQLLQAKNEVFDEAFRRASGELGRMRERPEYREFMRRAIQEALEELEGEAVVVHASPLDAPLCRELLKEMGRNCELSTDLESWGGVIATSADQKYIVTNTIESRLRRARELLRPRIFRILFGE